LELVGVGKALKERVGEPVLVLVAGGVRQGVGLMVRDDGNV